MLLVGLSGFAEHCRSGAEVGSCEGQPTTDAIDEVLIRVHQEHPEAQTICWINLR